MDVRETAAVVRAILQHHGTSGNWDFDPYMHGMYNGMELVLAAFENRAPEFRDRPARWVRDLTENSQHPEAVVQEVLEGSECTCHFVDIGVGHQKAAEDPGCPVCTTLGLALAVVGALHEAGMLTVPSLPPPAPSAGWEPWEAQKPSQHLTGHDFTRHGHPCCAQVSGFRPAAVSRCGGPGLCRKCGDEVAHIHASRAVTEAQKLEANNAI